MTISDFLSPRIASPFDQGGRSLWRTFLDRVTEARMQKAEDEVAKYLRRCRRQFPVGAILERQTTPESD